MNTNYNPSQSISEVIKIRSMHIAVRLSIILFFVFSILGFGFQAYQQNQNIDTKLQIDSDFLEEALEMGDLFFITRYLASFTNSGTLIAAGIKKTGSSDWISWSPKNEEKLNELGEEGIYPQLTGTIFKVKRKYHGGSDAVWDFYYYYKISHALFLYSLIVALFLSVLIFLFIKRLLNNTSGVIASPVENLSKDLDEQLEKIEKLFCPKHYKGGIRFEETDRFVQELTKLLTEIQNQEKELKKAEVFKAISRLSRQVSHDIRSPLGALQTAATFLEKSPEKSSNLIQKSIKRIETILEDLKVSGNDAFLTVLQKEETNLCDFLKEIVDEKKIENFGSDIEINLSTPQTEVIVWIDSPQVWRALSNIINNSIEATFDKTTIVDLNLSFFSETKLHLEISDNGPGISKEFHNKIFEYNFSQNKELGSGSGLYQAKTVFDAHGIDFYVKDSHSRLGGARFLLIIDNKNTPKK